MSSRTTYYLSLILLILLAVAQTASQRAFLDIFPDKKLVDKRPLTLDWVHRKNISATERYVSVFGYRNSKTLASDLHLYDGNGNLLCTKQLSYVKKVLLHDIPGKILVLHDIDKYGARGRTVCFDESGNELWETTVATPGIEAVSPDGKYGITRLASENNGRFRVFDLESGEELETPIPVGLYGFRANFLDSEHVVILIQNIDVEHDEEQTKRVLELKRKGNFSPRRGVPKTLIFAYHPAEYIVYHIPSKTILSQTELSTQDGTPLYLPIDEGEYMLPRAQEGRIILALQKPAILSDKKLGLTLIKVDLQGNVLWENMDLPKDRIRGLFNVDDTRVLINEPEGTYHLVDARNGKTLWRYSGLEKESSLLNHAYVDEHRLVLLTSHYEWKTRIHTLDIESGLSLRASEVLAEGIIFFGNQDRTTIIYDSLSKELRFLK